MNIEVNIHWLHGYFSTHKRTAFGVAVSGCVLVGVLDHLTGSELSFSLFYLGSISVAAWYCGNLPGYGIALLSALIWLAADLTAGNQYSQPWMSFWNSLIRFGVFVIVTALLIKLKDALDFEESLADTDQLTQLLNRRAFSERLSQETARSDRYRQVFTLAYFDLDNFKQVNDNMGHDVGDELLKLVGATLKRHTRSSDALGRHGGDEFTVLLPEVPPEAAKEALEKLHGELLSAMKAQGWPVTFSIGAISFTRPAGEIRDMLKSVDELMYQVKKHGKNGLLHKVH